MRLGEVFERFIQQAPISVMFRTLLEHTLDPAEIDRLFEENAEHQYTREILFSSIVELMGAVVCGAQLISRRSGKAYITWERFGELERRYPLPPARLPRVRQVT
jgi:hypothetical protein